MAEIIHSADCGNSPKNKAAEALAIALEGAMDEFDLLHGSAQWHRHERTVVAGADRIAEAAASAPPARLIIERVVTHGKAGAVMGQSDDTHFVHVFTFASAAATAVTRIDSFRKAEAANG